MRLNLGGVYVDLKNYDKAEVLLKKARDVMEEALGKEHPFYTWSLMYLGKLYSETGKYAQAEDLFLASKNILEKSLGKNNLFYEECLDQLALMYWASNRFDKAAENIREGLNIEKGMLADLSNYSSEKGLAAFISNFKGRRDRDLSFAQIHPSLIATCYDNTLFHKGFLLNAVSQINKIAQSNLATTEQYNQLKSYHRRLATEYAKPIAERKNVEELEEKANTLEKDLTRSVAGFGEAMRQVTWQEVQQKLMPGEAAVEFVHYKFVDPKPTDSTMYAALVLLPGAKEPAFIPLFEEKQLDGLLQPKGKSKPDFVDGLYTIGDAKNLLYDLLWQPLEQALSEAQTVYFSPSGLLHRLNLGVIAMPPMLRGEEPGETLADRYRLIELGSTRQLVVPSSTKSTGNDAMLYGGLLYEMDSMAIASAISSLGNELLATRRGLDFANADSTLRGGKWNYLRWTDVEVSSTEEIFAEADLRPTVRKGYEGTEESFKAIGTNGPSPRVLHLATHGFFFPDPKTTDRGRQTADGGEPVFKISDHPMIRSGLVLAGGNYAWQTGKPYRPDREDGILTAYEISQMNLSNTELVVLSACETGLGDIQGNEGVYGLQRAFKIAGAKYLIMSLWQVPDFQTQELMTNFYSLWLEDEMPIPDAFRAAQKAMRNKYKSPFLWAGFVLVE
ncbi:MAG: CHAT domain-containing protein [Saprospiraceae bacterium]|nr:CHAT domain-containing protein [Saprospiraceae bacterium]